MPDSSERRQFARRHQSNLFVPLPHEMSVTVQNDRGYVRVSCVSRGLKARRAARYRARHRSLIVAGTAADSP
jgi:hypothetical protein